MKSFLIAAAALIAAAGANAATFTSGNGFGGPGSYCNTNTNTTAFATGSVLGYTDQSCTGGFTVSLDTTAHTITLTNIVGSPFGDYKYGQLEITGITGTTITGLSTIQSNPLFNPEQFSFAPLLPTPQLSFTGSSILIVFDVTGDPDGLLFNYGGDGGQAIFSYSATGGVPEAATWAMMIAGFGLVGVTLRRKALIAA